MAAQEGRLWWRPWPGGGLVWQVSHTRRWAWAQPPGVGGGLRGAPGPPRWGQAGLHGGWAGPGAAFQPSARVSLWSAAAQPHKGPLPVAEPRGP